MELSGKEVREKKTSELKTKISIYNEKISFAIIKVGNNKASEVYVKNKIKYAQYVGLDPKLYELNENIKQEELEKLIDELNNDNKIVGLFVQLPLPNQIDEDYVTQLIDPQKDIDGFTNINLGKLLIGNEEGLFPCTVEGIFDILDYYNIDVSGKKVTIVGRSNIVGKPLAIKLINKSATVTSCNSLTKNLKEHIEKCDIFISAIGSPKYFTENFFNNPDMVVIDVGMNRDENGKLCGDVDYQNVKDKVSCITPVPGGVGVMTVTNVINNVIQAYENKRKINKI